MCFIGSILSSVIPYWLIKRGLNTYKVIRTTMLIVATMMIISIFALSLLLTWILGLPFWLAIFIFLAIFGIQYIIHPYLYIRGKGIRKPEGEETKLIEMLEDLKKSQGISYKVQLYVAETDIPNAFAIGNFFKKAIVINKGLLKVLGDEEVKAVLAHELGHIVRRDNAYMLASSLIPYFAYIISIAFILGGYFVVKGSSSTLQSSRGNNQLAGLFGVIIGVLILVLGFILLVLSIIVNASVMAFSRIREHLADLYSVKATKSIKIAHALLELDKNISKLVPQRRGFRKLRPDLRSLLYIVPTLEDDKILIIKPRVLRWITVFASHPRTEARVFVVQRYYQDSVSILKKNGLNDL